ncbi:MAG: hypothetical protein K2G09_07925 [Paramuribaculum sp.]|nr:hypothetical protein [Paramuribaculum sp.]
MKKIILIFALIVLALSSLQAQNVVTCAKQELLQGQKAQLSKQYGSEQVESALNGEIKEGMPEGLLLKAFNTESVKYDAEGCKAYNIYNDDILKKRKPNMPKPNPLYFVIVSDKKVVKIKPGEKNSRYKIRNGTIIY